MAVKPVLNEGRILVIVYGHVADTMAAIPGLRSLRKANPGARIEALVVSASEPVLRHCPYVDEVISWRDFQLKGTRLAKIEKTAMLGALGLRLRRRSYDAVVVFHRSFRSIRRLAAFSGAEVTAGISQGLDGYSHPASAPTGIFSSREENRSVLAAVGVEEDGGPTELWTTTDEERAASALLRSDVRGPLIGLHPGSDWSCQQWLPSHFGEVGRNLQALTEATVVITGSASEAGLQDEIVDGLVGPYVRAAGATTFGELVAVIRRLDLLISVNSAPAAIARAVGTPAVVLLGPEDARLTGLEAGPRVKVLQPGTRHAPGSWCEFGRWGVLSGCESPMCRGISGLDQLRPEDVVEAAVRMLGAAASHRTPLALEMAR